MTPRMRSNCLHLFCEATINFLPASGPDFLKEFRPGNFDLILLDLAMPVMDGFEVFDRIHRVDQKVPVVAITAMAYPPEWEKALQAGFCDYFVTPIMEIERFRQT